MTSYQKVVTQAIRTAIYMCHFFIVVWILYAFHEISSYKITKKLVCAIKHSCNSTGKKHAREN